MKIKELQACKQLKQKIESKHDLLYSHNRLYLVPQSTLIAKLLREYHGSPMSRHFGFHKSYKRLASKFYWERMQTQIEDYVRSCTVCQQVKYSIMALLGLQSPLPIG